MRTCAPLALVACALVATAVDAYEPAEMIIASKGSLPLILTVPHDGDAFMGFIAPRKNGSILRDAGTRELAERTASILEAKTGKRPYLVIALFSRKYADANRAQAQAIESDEALPAYLAYHDQISTYIAEVKQRFPNGSVLIDVHGQADVPGTTFRGTRSGLTTKSLLSRQGPSCLQGGSSITGLLAAKGYAVNPAPDATSLQEDSRFVGGHTVFHYGSHRPGGIDSIQLEFGRGQRFGKRFAEDLADALQAFMTQCGLATN